MTTDDQTAQPQDPAAAAFTRLEGEIALMRRAVENLASEKANIDIPDYSDTLGEMAESLAAVADTLDTISAKPAMAMTPKAWRSEWIRRRAAPVNRTASRSRQRRPDIIMRYAT